MGVVVRDPEILGGLPVFAGTRVPVKNLFDALIGGDSIPEFLDDFPTVTLDQVQAVLDEARRVVREPDVVELSLEQSRRVAEAMISPLAPNAALRAAFSGHRAKTTP